MESGPINVDGLRRLLNVSPEEMSDADLRRALALYASDIDPDREPAEVVQRMRTFADALNRAALG
jgi:hypothetical protein